MKIKHIPLFFSLFLGLNILKAQDTLKTYNIPEFIVNEKSEEQELKDKEKELKIRDFQSAMYSGSKTKALELNPIIQRPAPNLISSFFIEGVSPDVLGGFYVGNIPIMGKLWQQGGLSTILDFKLFDETKILNDFNSTKYEGLLSIIHTDIKSNFGNNLEFETSSNFFDRYIKINTPVERINGSISLYLDNREALWFIKNRFKETKFIPQVNSYQSNLELFNGRFNIAGFRYKESNNLEGNLNDNDVKLDLSSIHNFIIVDYNFNINNYKFMINGGWEEWSNNTQQSLIKSNYDDGSDININTKNYTLNFEAKNSNSILGLTYFSFKDDKTYDKLIDLLFLDELNLFAKYLSPELKQRIIDEYYKIPKEQRKDVVLRNLDDFSNSYPEISKLQEFQDFNTRIKTELEGINNPRKIEITKLYFDNVIIPNYLSLKNFLLRTTNSLSKFRNNFSLSSGIEAVYFFDKVDLGFSYMYNESFFRRDDIESLFKKDISGKQLANKFSLSSLLKIEDKLIDNIKVQAYYKKYNIKSNEYVYGDTKGFAISVNKGENNGYKAILSIGKSKIDNHPYLGSVDKMASLSTFYEINPKILTYLTLRYQDGYWSDRSTSGDYYQLGSSVNLDIGTALSFYLFKENDIRISAGIYNILGDLRDNLIFVYNNGEGYTKVKAPILGTLQLTFTY